MSEHTPGPWQEVAESGEWWITRLDDATPGSLPYICGTNNTREEDVDLICAAPELLGALEAAVAWIDMLTIHGNGVYKSAPDAPLKGELLPQLRAAIAKAKGGAQ